MSIRAIGLRQAFDHRILDFTCFNNMGLINPEAVAVSLVAFHFAVGGRTTKGVPYTRQSPEVGYGWYYLSFHQLVPLVAVPSEPGR